VNTLRGFMSPAPLMGGRFGLPVASEPHARRDLPEAAGERGLAEPGRSEPARSVTGERPLMFGYWGRIGPISKWMLDLAAVTQSHGGDCASFCYSSSNELEAEFRSFGDASFAVPTFDHCAQAFYGLRSMVALRSALAERLKRDRTKVFVSLMPHVWSPLMAPLIRRAEVKYMVVVHDAAPHPGDRLGIATRWILREAAMADHVITLSRFVANCLVRDHGFSESRISVLFHPDLDYRASRRVALDPAGPLRVLFAGRVLAYKGIDLLVEAAEILRRRDVRVDFGVYGRGEISASLRRRLSALDARVVNRWLSHEELAQTLADHDVVVAPHVEASQSGVIAAAFGAGVPVIATPVGGLVEQVVDGVTGLICGAATPDAVADSIGRLAEDRALLAQLIAAVAVTRNQRSMQQFFDDICRIALEDAPPPGAALPSSVGFASTKTNG
jgi:glycosyltransferase involved in cell wall biosynthesis